MVKAQNSDVTPSTLSDEERQERHEIIKSTEHSLSIEGLETSEYGKELATKWANGEITLDERRALVRKHHGLPDA